MDLVDAHMSNSLDKDKLKADIIKAQYETRSDYMRSGGFWLMLLFAAPLALWWASVILYSVLWCQGCAYPQSWTIAALPPPLDEWAGLIVVSIFGVIGVDRFKR
jgi:hypothetical protein